MENKKIWNDFSEHFCFYRLNFFRTIKSFGIKLLHCNDKFVIKNFVCGLVTDVMCVMCNVCIVKCNVVLYWTTS